MKYEVSHRLFAEWLCVILLPHLDIRGRRVVGKSTSFGPEPTLLSTLFKELGESPNEQNWLGLNVANCLASALEYRSEDQLPGCPNPHVTILACFGPLEDQVLGRRTIGLKVIIDLVTCISYLVQYGFDGFEQAVERESGTLFAVAKSLNKVFGDNYWRLLAQAFYVTVSSELNDPDCPYPEQFLYSATDPRHMMLHDAVNELNVKAAW